MNRKALGGRCKVSKPRDKEKRLLNALTTRDLRFTEVRYD